MRAPAGSSRVPGVATAPSTSTTIVPDAGVDAAGIDAEGVPRRRAAGSSLLDGSAAPVGRTRTATAAMASTMAPAAAATRMRSDRDTGEPPRAEARARCPGMRVTCVRGTTPGHSTPGLGSRVAAYGRDPYPPVIGRLRVGWRDD